MNPPQPALDPLQLLCASSFFYFIGLVISAAVLRTACSVHNSFVGGDGSARAVPIPDFSRALGIALVTSLVNWVLSAAGATAAYFLFSGDGARTEMMMGFAQLAASPVSLVVFVLMLAWLVPTSFGRALAITAIEFVLVGAIMLMLSCIVVGVFAMQMMAPLAK